jgi:hypothetical protein
VDNQPPVITCPGTITLQMAQNECNKVATFAATVTDNCSATVTYSPASGSVFNPGSTTVTATATDPAGNTVTCTFLVWVVDN